MWPTEVDDGFKDPNKELIGQEEEEIDDEIDDKVPIELNILDLEEKNLRT